MTYKSGHRNEHSHGPCYYYRLPSGQRVIFRKNEIKNVKRGISGGIVTTWAGCQYAVTSVFAEKVTPEDE